MKRIYGLGVVLPLIFASSVAFAEGHEIGNHADYLTPEDAAAWFNNSERAVHFCVKMAPDFGFTKSALEQKVNAAFKKWHDYIISRKINHFNLPKAVDVRETCDGFEDIRFEFGLLGSRPENKNSKLPLPVALTVRTSFDPVGSWGKGYISVAPAGSIRTEKLGEVYPNWTIDGNLDAILLHELGHVYGVGHVAGTIMDERIAYYLNRKGMVRPLTDIDFGTTLILKHGDYEGTLGVKVASGQKDAFGRSFIASKDTEGGNFELLMGRKPVGKIKARITSSETAQVLAVSDDKGSHNFTLSIIPWSANGARGVAVFKTVKTMGAGKNAMKTVDWATHSAGSSQGFITTVTGKKIFVNHVYNLQTLQPGDLIEGEGMFTVHAAYQIVQLRPSGAELLFASAADDGKVVINADLRSTP